VIQSVLADSLVIWKIDGTVEKEGDGFAIRIGSRSVAHVGPGRASRWLVRSEEGEREYASIVGALSAVREVLEVSAGPRLRIAPVRNAQ
jgi:hypothetical protein